MKRCSTLAALCAAVFVSVFGCGKPPAQNPTPPLAADAGVDQPVDPDEPVNPLEPTDPTTEPLDPTTDSEQAFTPGDRS